MNEKINPPWRFWTRARVNRLCVALIIGTLIGIPLSYLQTKNNKNIAVIQTGDFLGFYTAAVMIHEGLGKKLYDYDLQYKVQFRSCPNIGDHQYTPYPYPPFVALFLSPLARYSFQNAKWIFAGLMFFCLFLAILIGTRYAPILKKNYLATITFFLCFPPVLIGVVGAQTSALSMLFYAGAIGGLAQGTKRGELICGICLGLWLFKPQYALIAIIFFVFSRSWRIVAAASVVGIIYYLIGAIVSGLSWPAEWLKTMPEHGAECFKINTYVMISLLGFVKACGAWISKKPVSVNLFDLVPSLLLFFWVASKFWAVGKLSTSDAKKARLQRWLDLTGPAILLISPQPVYYDFGICLLPCAKYLKLENDTSITFFIMMTALLSLATALHQSLPFQPVFFGVIGIFLFIYKTSSPNNIRNSRDCSIP
jgi:hypothetical protein